MLNFMQRLPRGFYYGSVDQSAPSVVTVHCVLQVTADRETDFHFELSSDPWVYSDEGFFAYMKDRIGLNRGNFVDLSFCDDSSCPGWLISDPGRYPGLEIQRCDQCMRFLNDTEAMNHVLALLVEEHGSIVEALREKERRS